LEVVCSEKEKILCIRPSATMSIIQKEIPFYQDMNIWTEFGSPLNAIPK